MKGALIALTGFPGQISEDTGQAVKVAGSVVVALEPFSLQPHLVSLSEWAVSLYKLMCPMSATLHVSQANMSEPQPLPLQEFPPLLMECFCARGQW